MKDERHLWVHTHSVSFLSLCVSRAGLHPPPPHLTPPGWEHLEGISVENKPTPEGWTKLRSRGGSQRSRPGTVMWTQKKDLRITSD